MVNERIIFVTIIINDNKLNIGQIYRPEQVTIL